MKFGNQAIVKNQLYLKAFSLLSFNNLPFGRPCLCCRGSLCQEDPEPRKYQDALLDREDEAESSGIQNPGPDRKDVL